MLNQITNQEFYKKEDCDKKEPHEYRANPTHRTNHNDDKSQWEISLEEEYKIFENTVFNNWFTLPNENNKIFGYGIFLPQEKENTPKQIGSRKISHSNETKKLYIAKFVVDETLWHGYPCGDKESDFFTLKNFKMILEQWIDLGYIKKAQFHKIHKGRSL